MRCTHKMLLRDGCLPRACFRPGALSIFIFLQTFFAFCFLQILQTNFSNIARPTAACRFRLRKCNDFRKSHVVFRSQNILFIRLDNVPKALQRPHHAEVGWATLRKSAREDLISFQTGKNEVKLRNFRLLSVVFFKRRNPASMAKVRTLAWSYRLLCNARALSVADRPVLSSKSYHPLEPLAQVCHI